MVRYVFADRPLIINNVDDADPQVIGEALEKIAKANQGHLKAEAVLEAAKNRRHVLHRHFEWDDAKAANAFRLDQARMIVRSVAIEGEEESEPVQAFHSVTDKGGRSYRHHGEVLGSARLQRLVLESAKRDLVSYRQRYKRYSDLFEPGLSQAIDRLDQAMENNDRAG
jgi:hypothetical protein